MTLPIIHSNGTSARELAEGYYAARIAMEKAITALAKVEFNARDYYVKDGAWVAARLEREEMFNDLRRIKDVIMKHEFHCSDSIHPRH